MRIFLLAALTLCACGGTHFDAPTRILDMRIVAVQAEPPEVLAGETSRLSALAVGPEGAGPVLAVHFVCSPDTSGANPCTAFEPLRDPGAVLRSAHAGICEEGPDALGTAMPGGLALVGAEVCDPSGDCQDLASGGASAPPVVRIPPEMSLDLLPQGDPDRVLGRELVVITMLLHGGAELLEADGCAGIRALPGTVADRVEAGRRETDWTVAIKRLRLRGPDAGDERNLNPAPPLAEAPDSAAPSQEYQLTGTSTSAPQTYMERGPDGQPGPMTQERFTFSWFATDGDLEWFHTLPGAEEPWIAPDHAAEVRMWLVVRDLRGGVAWTSRVVQVR